MFFKDNLKEILDKAELAKSSMLKRAKERGMNIDEGYQKDFITKIMLESVNRQIFTHLHSRIKAEDLTYSK